VCPLTAAMVRGNENVTVRLEAKVGSKIGAVFGIRMIRAKNGTRRPAGSRWLDTFRQAEVILSRIKLLPAIETPQKSAPLL
jgi:hypothetical protein